MERFGDILRRHRKEQGLSQRQLGELAYFHYTHISQVECGLKRPSAEFADRCDRVLRAGGALVEAYETEVGGSGMPRRAVLRTMGAFTAAPVVSSEGWEALRHGLGVAANCGYDEWDEIVSGYGRAYYQMPQEVLMAQLHTDLAVLHEQLAADTGKADRLGLLRAASRLSVIVALGLVASGQTMLARRWWTTAQRISDQSGDPDTQVLARAWDVVNGCYDNRPPTQVVALSDQMLPLLGQRAAAASCGLLAGRAQALALAGRHAEAVATVQQLSDLAEQLPAPVINDVESLWGWPEHRLRHTESWVFTHVGRLNEAEAAQDRALDLYPRSQARLRTQVQLHRAACLIRGGHIPDGLRLAADLLDTLPPESHNELVKAVVRQVAASVPPTERGRPVYAELTDRMSMNRILP